MVTPTGVAAYAWLTKPDTAFGQEKFKLTILLEKNKENDAFVESVRKIHDAHRGTSKNVGPVKDGDKTGKDGQEGHWLIEAKSNYQPKLIDTERQEITNEREVPMSGDLVKMAFKAHPYEAGPNAGISLVLNAVQLVEKRNAGVGIAAVFPDVQGFVASEQTEKSAAEAPFDF